MTYAELINALEEEAPEILAQWDAAVPIYGVMPVEEPVTAQSNILYIVKNPEALSLLELPASGCVSVLVLGQSGKIPEGLKSAQLNLCRIENENGVRSVVHTFAALDMQERKCAQAIRELDQVFFGNKGNQKLLNRACELLGCPIVQLGLANEQVLMSWDEQATGEYPALEKLLLQIRDGGKRSTPDVEGSLFNGYGMSVPENGAMPLHRYNTGLDCDQITVGIQVRSMEVGVLTAFARGRVFGTTDYKILAHLSALVEQELQKKSLYALNSNEKKAQILNHLISSPAVSDDYISKMARRGLVTEIRDKFYIAVIGQMDEASRMNTNLFPDLLAQLRPITAYGMYLIRDTELVILFSLPEKVNFHELADALLSEKCKQYGLYVGISNMYRNLRETFKHYQQAQRSASLGALYRDSVVNYFSDIAPKEILHFMARHEDLLSFCMPEVLDLMKYDKENGTDLVDTLYVYLEHGCSTTEAANALFIHKNTLLYRIGRIREILQCDMKRGEDLYKLLLSMRILWTLMLYTPPHLRKE